MMKFNALDYPLLPSSFVIRPARYALKLISIRFTMPMSYTSTRTPQSTSHGRRVFCGSFLNFFANCREGTI